jgi:hypothetical protein
MVKNRGTELARRKHRIVQRDDGSHLLPVIKIIGQASALLFE